MKKDTYTRYMEYIEKNRSKRERETTIDTFIEYSFEYVPLIIIVLSIIMIVLLVADVFSFCSSETIEDLWVYALTGLMCAGAAYGGIRSAKLQIEKNDEKNMKKEKEKDTYTRYMEYLEKNRSKRAMKIALKTCFVYASHYVPLIVIALSVVVIGLLFADVFAFCGAETISDLWFYSIAALLGVSIYYALVRYFTSDIDLLTYDHLPFTRDIHKERREFAKWWAKNYE